jgi:hypothetical protein
MCIDTPLAAALGLDGARPRPQSLVRSLNEGGAWTGRGSWRWSRRRALLAAAREPLDHRDLYQLLSFVVQAHAHRWESAAAPEPARAALFHRPQPWQAKLKERSTAAMKGFAQNDVMRSRHAWPGSSNEGCFSRIGARIRPGRSGGPGAACRLVGEEDDFASCQLAFKLMPRAGSRRRAKTSMGSPFPQSQPWQAQVKERLTAEMKGFRNNVMPSRRTWSGSEPMTGASGAILHQVRLERGQRPAGEGGHLYQSLTFCLQAQAHGGNPPPRQNQHARPFSTVRIPVKRR